MRRFPARAPLLALLLASLAACGCQEGIRWRLGTFDEGYAEAQRDRRVAFVYFRSWYDVECTRFEQNVLMDPAVREATSTLTNIPLEFDYDRALAAKWGLTDPPAIAVVGPDMRMLANGQGPGMTVQSVLDAIRRAQATATAPASGPASQPVP